MKKVRIGGPSPDADWKFKVIKSRSGGLLLRLLNRNRRRRGGNRWLRLVHRRLGQGVVQRLPLRPESQAGADAEADGGKQAKVVDEFQRRNSPQEVKQGSC